CTTPTFSWTTAPVDGTVGDADITLGVNKGLSTGAVTYTSSNPAVATVVDGKLHYVASGSTTITATVAADGTYCEATLTETIDVTCATPSTPLTITATPTVITMGETANIAVTGGNGGEVTYSVAPATASVSAGVFNASAAGTYVITATQAEYNGECGGTATATIQVNEVLLPTYTLSYVLNGHGTAIADATVSALPNPLPTPSETGWTFNGWFTDNTLTTPATPGAIINTNTTLYAKWTEVVAGGCAETYTYAYNDATRYDGTTYMNPLGNPAASGDNVALTTPWTMHSGTGIASIVLTGGQYDGKGNHMNAYIKMNTSASLVITLANDAVGTLTIKAGGYSAERTLTLSADGQTAQSKTTTGVATTENDFGELTFTLYPGVNTIKVNNNTYISHVSVATECLALYNITTDPTIVGGTVNVVDEAAAGTNVTLSATPATGYVLESWTVKDASDNLITVTDNKFTMPASNVTVSATFRLIRTYTVKFEGNGATGGTMTDQTGIQEGVATPLTANAFTNGAKIFNGWNTLADGSGTAYADGASVTLTDANTTLTLYEQWKDPATYTVSFSLNGKTGTAPTNVTVVEGEKITKPTPDPEVADYTFAGWYKEPACTNAWNFETDVVTTTTTLYAKWNLTSGCETLFMATSTSSSEFTPTVGTTTGSTGITGGESSPYAVKLNGDKSYIQLNALSGTTFTEGDVLSVTLYNKANGEKELGFKLKGTSHVITIAGTTTDIVEYTLTAADIESDGSIKIYRTSSDDRYVSIQVERCAQYTITCLATTNGAIVADKTSAAAGATITLTATPNAGYVLDNVDVYKSDDPTTKVTVLDNQFTMPAYDVTVAPTFRAAETITIAYDANGGQGTMTSQTVTEGQIITLSTNTFTHDDPTATFAGWNTKADGTGVAYTDGQAVALVGNTTLYAQWNFGPCFSMEFLTSGSITSQTYLGDAHAVIKQGVVFYDRVEEGKTMEISNDGAKFNSKDDYLKVTLGDRVALAAGTKVTVTIHVGGNNRGVAILASDKTTKIAELNKTDGTGGEATLTYTITDPTFNENIFYITRSTDNTSYLKSIIIENCGDYCPEFVPNVTIDYTKFCSTSPQMVDIKVDDFTMGAKLRLFKSGEALALAEVTVAGSEYVFTDIEAVVGDVYYVEAEHTCVVTSELVTISEQALTITPLAEGWYIKDGRIAPDIALFKVKGVADTWTVTTSPALSGATYTLGTDGIVRMSGVLDINAPQVYVFTLTVDNGCVSTPVTSSLSMNGQVATTKPTLAFVTIGTKDAADTNGESGFTQGIDPDQSTNLDLYKYLLNPDPSDPNSGFNITAVNAYATADEAKIRAYYSQFDLVLVTDYPDTNEEGDANKSYINALGTLLDVIPILSMETFLAKQPNWQINSTPTDPEVKQDKMTLLCPSHDVFADIGLGAGDIVQMFTTMGEKGMQGFVPLTAPDYMFIATIDGGSKGDLITCCERQVEVKARMIMLGLNYTSMESITNDGKKIVNQMLHYLLRKNADDVADCSMTFTNGQKDDGTTIAGSGDYLWSNPKNWGPTYNMIPTPYHNVRIEKKCIVDVPNAHASLIKLRKDATTVPTNPKDGSVIINANGGLTVVGKMVEVRGKNFITTYPTQAKDVYIKADATGNGALAIGGNEGDVNATVDFYSKARDAGEENPVWQYVGAPFSDMNNAIDYYRLVWMCRWTEEVHGIGANWEWVRNEDNMQPFRGYCITHVDNTKTYTFTGKLNASSNRVIQLTANGDSEYKGWNLIANSWMAPLQIDKMKTSDFGAGADAALYIYNTGSYADWEAHKGVYKDQQYAPAGQYTTVPVGAVKILNEAGNADLPSTIAPMQAFFVLTTANTVLQLNHDNLLFNENYTQTTSPMRAPRRAKVQNEDVNVLRIDVKGEYAADKMWIMQADSFSLAYDNGYDGKKILGDAFVPQLAVATADGEMAIAALPQYEGTRLMFRKGSEDELYTLSFQYAGTPLLLRDLLTGDEVEIITGNTYAFYATNEQLAERFEIVKKPESQGGVVTGLTAVVDDKGLHIGNASATPLTVSVYTPDGRLIQQHQISDMHYTLSLPMTGAYIVRLQSEHESKIVKVIR
ncbi:MAG: InlB B-repeat-containing protein, partial [Paludibacteraceae bacterium]|nr:InlB B-repeat-containing protein [Paludibacteraceae bacterium]